MGRNFVPPDRPVFPRKKKVLRSSRSAFRTGSQIEQFFRFQALSKDFSAVLVVSLYQCESCNFSSAVWEDHVSHVCGVPCTRLRSAKAFSFSGRYVVLMSSNKDDTAVHGRHCPGDMAVCMPSLMARPLAKVCHLL